MYIKSLKLSNFRNYSNVFTDFSPYCNIIYGLNAEGKTNLIESLYFLSNFSSFRTSKNKEMINFNSDYFNIDAVFNTNDKDFNLKVYYNKQNKYNISLNSVNYKAKNQVIGKILTVVFSPDDLYLIKNSGETRRKFLNESLCQLRPRYFILLKEFNKCIKEKNYILKNYDNKPSLLDVLDDYNEKIIKLSAEISYIRANFINILKEFTKQTYNDISSGRENLDMEYVTKLTKPEFSIQNNEEEYKNLIKLYEKTEKSSKNALIGCHKDDIFFKINNTSAKEYASQGQTRSIVLALKLALREVFFKDSGSLPILLLDDVLSELDKTRQDFIINKIKDGQIFITTPYFNEIKLDGKLININNGNIKT